MEVFAGATEIEADMLAELEALPRPPADAEEIEAGARSRRRVAPGRPRRAREAAPELRPRLFERRVNETIPVLADLRSRFTALGATGCVSYYDPNSYAVG